jgi:hypothetical protein
MSSYLFSFFVCLIEAKCSKAEGVPLSNSTYGGGWEEHEIGDIVTVGLQTVRIKDLNTGVVYESIKDAAKDLGLTSGIVGSRKQFLRI